MIISRNLSGVVILSTWLLTSESLMSTTLDLTFVHFGSGKVFINFAV